MHAAAACRLPLIRRSCAGARGRGGENNPIPARGRAALPAALVATAVAAAAAARAAAAAAPPAPPAKDGYADPRLGLSVKVRQAQ
eukprot:gene39181-42319_t